MKTDKVFIDTNIPMYAAGRDEALKNNCLEVLASIADGKLQACTSAEVFQEILHRFIHIGDAETGRKIIDEFYVLMKGWILPVTIDDILAAKVFSEKYPKAPSRDLLHLAVMKNNGITTILTVDNHFDMFEEVRRVSPGQH